MVHLAMYLNLLLKQKNKKIIQLVSTDWVGNFKKGKHLKQKQVSTWPPFPFHQEVSNAIFDFFADNLFHFVFFIVYFAAFICLDEFRARQRCYKSNQQGRTRTFHLKFVQSNRNFASKNGIWFTFGFPCIIFCTPSLPTNAIKLFTAAHFIVNDLLNFVFFVRFATFGRFTLWTGTLLWPSTFAWWRFCLSTGAIVILIIRINDWFTFGSGALWCSTWWWQWNAYLKRNNIVKVNNWKIERKNVYKPFSAWLVWVWPQLRDAFPNTVQ